MAKKEKQKEEEKPQPKAAPKQAEVPAPAPVVRRFARAIAKYLQIAPRKVRPVINSIRYKPPHEAKALLATYRQKGARLAEKVLTSALANARVLKLDENRLYISDVRADGGPTLKRFMSRSMGRADRILKRTTHLSMVLTEGERVLSRASRPEAGSEPEKKSMFAKAAKSKKLAAKAAG